jgi:hypothetical protein
MKRITNYVTTAAAVLIATTGVASAQNRLKAEVPFAFHVGSNVMEPGTIRVRVVSRNTAYSALIVNNYDSKRSYIVLPKSVSDAPEELEAERGAEAGLRLQPPACVLAKAWNDEVCAYEFSRPKTKSGETLLTEIMMNPDRGN